MQWISPLHPAQVIFCTIWNFEYVWSRNSLWNPNCGTLEPDRPQHNRPASRVIAQQYSSDTPNDISYSQMCFHNTVAVRCSDHSNVRESPNIYCTERFHWYLGRCFLLRARNPQRVIFRNNQSKYTFRNFHLGGGVWCLTLGLYIM